MGKKGAQMVKNRALGSPWEHFWHIRSWNAHETLICTHVALNCAHIALTSCSHRAHIALTNESSLNALIARQERDFPIWASVYPFWVRGERSLSAMWAPKMRSPLFGVFEHNLSARRARPEREQIEFEREMSAKIALRYSSILPLHIKVIRCKVSFY